MSNSRTKLALTGRRAAFEVLEGRSMLSGTGLDVPAANIQAGSFIAGDIYQIAYLEQLTDGGFVTFSVSGISKNADTAFLGSYNTIDVLISRGSQLSSQSVSGSALYHSSAPTPGISAALFDQPTVEASTQSADGPQFAGSFDNPGRAEGGPIAIESILAQVPRGGSPLVGDSKALLAKSSVTPQGGARSGSRNDVISGELAQAIVFETAGGESANSSQRGTIGHRTIKETTLGVTDRLGRETDTTGAYQRGERSTSQVELASHQTHHYRSTRRADEQDANSDEAANSLIMDDTAVEQQNDAAIGATMVANVDGDDVMTAKTANDISNSARAAAIERLDEADQPTVYLAGSYARHALVASPLLVMLAMERIAARNSRRASKQSSIVPGERRQGTA